MHSSLLQNQQSLSFLIVLIHIFRKRLHLWSYSHEYCELQYYLTGNARVTLMILLTCIIFIFHIQQMIYQKTYSCGLYQFPCNIDSFETTGLWPRPETCTTKTETHKNGLKTSSLQIIQQSCWINKVVTFIDL